MKLTSIHQNKAYNNFSVKNHKCMNKRFKIDKVKIGTTATALISILSLNTPIIQGGIVIDK